MRNFWFNLAAIARAHKANNRLPAIPPPPTPPREGEGSRLRQCRTTSAWSILLALSCFLKSGFSSARESNPPVPPGRNSGGIPVAVIGPGIDYTQPHLAQMLARDGEGEITGYDFIDDDRRPFEAKVATDDLGRGTRVAEIVTGEGQAATLVAVRAKMDDAVTLTKAIKFAAQSPARIIAIDRAFATPIDMEMFNSAAHHYRENLFIVMAGDGMAGDGGTDLDPAFNARFGEKYPRAANLLVVAACDQNGVLTPKSNWGAATVDVAVDVVSHFVVEDGASLPNDPNLSSIALARVAALAARLLAVEPHIRGAAFKERIVRLAAALPDQAGKSTRAGFIERQQRHFWLE